MSIVAGVVGVIAFVRRQSLIGEALSHAAYPGLVAGVLFLVAFMPQSQGLLWYVMLAGALLFAGLGYRLLHMIQHRMRLSSDVALCILLSSALGVAVLLSSRLQTLHPGWLQEIHIFLCGQAATMTQFHMIVYMVFAFVVLTLVAFLFFEIRTVSFDPIFAKLSGSKIHWIERMIMGLLIFTVIFGIRSVGVVLMAGMFIAPAITARALTHRFSTMLVIAAVVGGLSGFLGNVLALEWSYQLMEKYPNWHISLPTGPMILCVATGFAISASLLSPREGLFVRLFRVWYFRFRCLRENILKFLWKRTEGAAFSSIKEAHHVSFITLWFVLRYLVWKKWVISEGLYYQLLPTGVNEAQQIVRRHRLWELYLHSQLGIADNEVHMGAEEMEHVITDDIEEQLDELLNRPTKDPHQQPIPEKSRGKLGGDL